RRLRAIGRDAGLLQRVGVIGAGHLLIFEADVEAERSARQVEDVSAAQIELIILLRFGRGRLLLRAHVAQHGGRDAAAAEEAHRYAGPRAAARRAQGLVQVRDVVLARRSEVPLELLAVSEIQAPEEVLAEEIELPIQ